MDQKDLKIIKELEKDARQSNSSIAKIVGLSKPALASRIQKLEEKNIIDGYMVVTDALKLGYNIYTICFKLQGAAANVKSDIVSFIKQQPEVGWCISLLGSYDIIFALITKNHKAIQNVLHAIETHFSDKIKETDLLHNTTMCSYPHAYLFGDSYGDGFADCYEVHTNNLGELSSNEYTILNYFKQNPRSQVVDVVNHTTLSRDTVRRTLYRLATRKILLRCKAHINIFELGYQWHLLLISVRSFTDNTHKELMEYMKQHPNFVYVVECIGKWQFLISIHSKDNEEFKQIHGSFHEKFDDIIKNEEVLQVSERQKHTFIPLKYH